MILIALLIDNIFFVFSMLNKLEIDFNHPGIVLALTDNQTH